MYQVGIIRCCSLTLSEVQPRSVSRDAWRRAAPCSAGAAGRPQCTLSRAVSAFFGVNTLDSSQISLVLIKGDICLEGFTRLCWVDSNKGSKRVAGFTYRAGSKEETHHCFMPDLC